MRCNEMKIKYVERLFPIKVTNTLIVCYLPGFIATNSYETARLEIAALRLQITQNQIITPSKRIANVY